MGETGQPDSVSHSQAGTLLLRSIGLARAKARIGLRNLIYNLQRFTYLVTQVYVWA